MGPGRYISGCDRRIPHANAHSNSNSNSYSYCHSDGNGNSNTNGDSDSNGNSKPHSYRNRYIDAINEPYPYSYSYWHKYTETYSYSKSSSVHSASSDTGAETVAIFPEKFSRSATADKGRSHQFGTSACERCRIVSNIKASHDARSRVGALSHEISQNCVDTFPGIQVERAFHCCTR
jgi:hypothetical protein